MLDHPDMVSRQIVGQLAREIIDDYAADWWNQEDKYPSRVRAIFYFCERMGVTIPPSPREG